MPTVACTSCGKSLRAKPEHAGKSIRCPACGHVFLCEISEERKAAIPTAGRKAGSDASAKALVANADPDLAFLGPAQAADELGRLGNFRVLGKLGAGGMGLVFLAEDPVLQRKLALKVMLPSIAQDAKARARFLREARSAAALDHENIITVHSVGEQDGVPFLAMPLLKGLPLDKYLEDRKAPSADSSGMFFAKAMGQFEPLSIDEVLRFGGQIAEGLAAAHATGLIHRDIKPANIWLEELPGPGGTRRWRVKILDFGLARAANEAASLTQSGVILGSPAYMAPEQARGEKLDFHIDLWSLGCVLYEMTTGQRAFPGSDTMSVLRRLASETPPAPTELTSKLPPGLSKLIMQLLDRDPAGRPASAAEVAERLDRIARGDVSEAERETPKVQPKKKGLSTNLILAMAAAVLLLTVAGTVAAYVLTR